MSIMNCTRCGRSFDSDIYTDPLDLCASCNNITDLNRDLISVVKRFIDLQGGGWECGNAYISRAFVDLHDEIMAEAKVVLHRARPKQ